MWIISVIYRLFICVVFCQPLFRSKNRAIVHLFSAEQFFNFRQFPYCFALFFFSFFFIMLNNRQKPDIFLLYWIVLHDHCFLFGFGYLYEILAHCTWIDITWHEACMSNLVYCGNRSIYYCSMIFKNLPIIFTPATYMVM